MKNILEAISYVHSKGIIHRDLKPENLILKSKDNDYDVKIADFGLASFIKDGEKLNLPCGSPGYVGPEVLDSSFGGYDTKADIFSIGVILYVLLTGWPAFPGANVNDIITKNKIADVQFPVWYWSRISDKAKDLVQRMLVRDPSKWLSAVEALEHPWFA